jgi:hypothetical protein
VADHAVEVGVVREAAVAAVVSQDEERPEHQQGDATRADAAASAPVARRVVATTG